MSITIHYQDPSLIIVSKPSGLLTHPNIEANKETDLTSELKKQLNQSVYPIHRLDRATSGIICLCFNKGDVKLFQELWIEQKVYKEYICLVRGKTPEEFISHHPLSDLKTKVKKEARTDFKTIRHYKNLSLIMAIPRTGRTHQIRRHLARLGHHIIGDTTYGKGGFNRQARENGLQRLFLHARVLQFINPINNKPHLVYDKITKELSDHLDFNASADLPSH
jgi:tRNA pseudouridine65 synthase